MTGEAITAANQLAALLRLLATAHEDIRNAEAQAAVALLLPIAARMADDIAAMADEAESAPACRAAG